MTIQMLILRRSTGDARVKGLTGVFTVMSGINERKGLFAAKYKPPLIPRKINFLRCVMDQEYQKHIQQAGEKNIEICLNKKLHLSCKNKDCSVLDMLADLSDEEVKGAMKVFARILHFKAGENTQIFQHLVQENERRKNDWSDTILGRN